MIEKIIKNEEESFDKAQDKWKEKLTPEQYHILREKGTEPPFSGRYYQIKDKGIYLCAACGNELFSSETKFDSGTGWPSFTDPMNLENIEFKEDRSHGIVRTEVLCKKCGSHLGHIFNDGPKTLPDGRQATGKRFCINSLALELIKEKGSPKENS